MSKTPKKPLIIGISGIRGSFSEEAAQVYMQKAGLKGGKLAYLVSVENVLKNLEEGAISLGISPIENSNGGIVIEAVHAMAGHRFRIKKIFEIQISMNLLVRKGTTATQVKRIVSHDQALKQCRQYLKRRWPKVRLAEYPDTAKAAEDVAAGTLPPGTGAIASLAAAKAYKLDVLEEGIQDLKFNYTTFVVTTR